MNGVKERIIKNTSTIAGKIAGGCLLACVCLYGVVSYLDYMEDWKLYCSSLVVYIWAGLAFSYGLYLVRKKKFYKGTNLILLSVVCALLVHCYLSVLYAGSEYSRVFVRELNRFFLILSPFVCLGLLYGIDKILRSKYFKRIKESWKIYLALVLYFLILVGTVMGLQVLRRSVFLIWGDLYFDYGACLVWLILANIICIKAFPEYFVKKKKYRSLYQGKRQKVLIRNAKQKQYEPFWSGFAKKEWTPEQIVRKKVKRCVALINLLFAVIILRVDMRFSRIVAAIFVSPFSKDEWNQLGFEMITPYFDAAKRLIYGAYELYEEIVLPTIPSETIIVITTRTQPLASLSVLGGWGLLICMLILIAGMFIAGFSMKYTNKTARNLAFYIKVSLAVSMAMSIITQFFCVSAVFPTPFLGTGAGYIMLACICGALPIIFNDEKEKVSAEALRVKAEEKRKRQIMQNIVEEEEDVNSYVEPQVSEGDEPELEVMKFEHETAKATATEEADFELEEELEDEIDEAEENLELEEELEDEVDEAEENLELEEELEDEIDEAEESLELEDELEDEIDEAEENLELEEELEDEIDEAEEKLENKLEEIEIHEAEPNLKTGVKKKCSVQKMTAAYANQLIKSLEEEKEYWVNKEAVSRTYTAALNEEPVIPEYDYMEVASEISRLNEKISAIRHALNMHNVTARVMIGEQEMSIDMILLKMEQLNNRKMSLDFMRKQLPKTRVSKQGYKGKTQIAECSYINYDLDLIKKEYEDVSQKIMEMQMALDTYNQTVQFEVEL